MEIFVDDIFLLFLSLNFKQRFGSLNILLFLNSFCLVTRLAEAFTETFTETFHD